jgi:hypothetical protein
MRFTADGKQRSRFERGQAIILVVLAIIGVIGMTALAVDGGRIFLERRNVQGAADSIAMGAALARVRDPQGKWVLQAYAVARENGYDNNGATNSVMIYSPPVTGNHMQDIEYIQVLVSSRIKTYFGAVIGIRSSTVVGESISRTKAPELTQLLDGNAVVSLRTTSTCTDINDMSFWIHGESTLSITGSGIFVNSNNPNCALMQSANGSIRLKDEGAQIRVVGGIDIKKPQLVTPFPPLTNAQPISYPPPFFMPQVGCHRPAEISLDGTSMTSGTWESPDSFPPPGVRFLGPGVYCIINTNFIAKGGDILEGKNVLFKVEGGKVQIGGDSNVVLTAPDSGDLAGLLFYLPMDNHKPVVLSLGDESRFKGTVLAPGAEIRINGNASDYGYHSQFVGYSILSDGSDDVQITYVDDENYDAYTFPEVQLVK